MFFLIYGANGYTGKLIAEEAARRGLQPVLAGRNPETVRALAARLSLESRVFALDSPEEILTNLEGIPLVLNCAGPFSATARPMVEACLARSVHYLDVAGDIPVLEYLYSLHEEAVRASCVVLPAVGFDVVPTDCLALMLKERLPGATRLRLAFDSDVRQSPGTWKTTLEAAPRGGRIRRNGELVRVPMASGIHRIMFDHGRRWTMRLPWGDLSSAYRTTGIPNIEVAAGTSLPAALFLRGLSPLFRALRLSSVRGIAERLVDRFVRGPDEEHRTNARVHMRGDAWDEGGKHLEMRLVTPEGYALTVLTALAAVSRVLDGGVAPGAHTPAQAFGPDFIFEFPGVRLPALTP